MKTEDTIIPLVLMGILVLSSIAPVIQIMILHWTSIFAYPFEMIGGIADSDTLNYANLLYGVICISGFYFSSKTGFKIIWAVLTVFFLTSFFTNLWEFKEQGSEPYFLGHMVSGFFATLSLLVLGFVKEKRTKE